MIKNNESINNKNEKIDLDKVITHDNEVYYPLNGASYFFNDNFISYIVNNLKKKNLIISIGAQPNSSPHLGTIITFMTAFSLASKIKNFSKKINVEVLFEIVDSAPSEILKIDNIVYQINLRNNPINDNILKKYIELLDFLEKISGITYKTRNQEDFNKQEEISSLIEFFIKKRRYLNSIFGSSNKFVIRISCPICGLTDKKGVNNKYFDNSVECLCPYHGRFKINIQEQPHLLEYNTPLRNLIRALVYSKQNKNKVVPFEWLRVTGSDYAGYYQEQALYRVASFLGIPVHELPMIVYSPLILDWSGAKLSKSLSIKQNAYRYLPSYLVNYDYFKESFGKKGLEIIYEEVLSWIDNPYKLFRHYSVYYFINLFKKRGLCHLLNIESKND